MQKNLLNDYEQYILRQCFEVSCIPEKPDENTNQIIMDITEAIGIDVSEDEISYNHRLSRRTGQ